MQSGVWVAIALGGAVGSALRFGVSRALGEALGPGFPWGTLGVNALGCFAMGALLGPGGPAQELREPLRLGLVVGVLGGFTTFSAFAFETVRLVQAGHAALGLANAGANVVGCLLACAAGMALASR
jgi:CrcB protein